MHSILLSSPVLFLVACVEDLKPGAPDETGDPTETSRPDEPGGPSEIGDAPHNADPEETGETGAPEEEDPLAGLPEAAAALCTGQTPTLPIANEDEAIDIVMLTLPIVETTYIVSEALSMGEYLAQPWAGCATLSSDPFTGATLLEANCVGVRGYTLTGSLRWLDTDDGFALWADELVVFESDEGNMVLDGMQVFKWLDETQWVYEAQGRVGSGAPGVEPKDRELALEASQSEVEERMAGWISVTSGLGERTGGACIWYHGGESVDACEETDPVGLIMVGADTYEDVEECEE